MMLTRVLHQQFTQLRWYLLACIGLIMVLPIEETIVNLLDRDGHYQSGLAAGIIIIVPLLTALIACANVQADLEEKRDLFWRSKPVGVCSFISTKFLAGLLLSLAVVACPVLYTWGLATVFHEAVPFRGYRAYVINILLISLLTYSISFFCNVLVRKTARAWLIGMAFTGFVLLIPIMFFIQFTDMATDIQNSVSKTYLILTLGVALVGFMLANLATQRNWHIQTNLKGLLWAGTGLVFVLALLAARQVANIPVLDDKQVSIGPDIVTPCWKRPIQIADRVIVTGFQENNNNFVPEWKTVCSVNNKLVWDDIPPNLADLALLPYRPLKDKYTLSKNSHVTIYPYDIGQAGIPYRLGSKTFILALFVGWGKKSIEGTEGVHSISFCESVILRSFSSQSLAAIATTNREIVLEPIDTLDMTDVLKFTGTPRVALRMLGEHLVVAVNNRVATIHVREEGDLLPTGDARFNYVVQTQENIAFDVPLLPFDNLDIHQRIQMSIDLVFTPRLDHFNQQTSFTNTSLVDFDGDTIRFASIDRKSILCYEVIDWNQEKIKCRLRSKRQLTWLDDFHEHEPYFVQNGKLYAYTWNKLMVFDLRSEKGIRKLGHFQRLQNNFRILDVVVEECGNILLFNDQWPSMGIYLLKDPQR